METEIDLRPFYDKIAGLQAEIERLRADMPAHANVILSEENDRLIDDNKRLRAALNSIVGMALGSVGIGKIHQTAVNALNDEQSAPAKED